MRLVKSAKRSAGFTLIELIVVVAIIAIIGTIAVANYEDYITRGRRTDATAALMEMANLQTRFYSNNLRYTGTIASLPYPAQSMENYYDLSILSISTTTFSLRATAKGLQLAKDTDCPTIDFTALGAKTPADCW